MRGRCLNSRRSQFELFYDGAYLEKGLGLLFLLILAICSDEMLDIFKEYD